MPLDAAAMTTLDRKPGLLALLKEDVDSVLDRDPAARGRLEVLVTYPGLHAILLHRLAHRLWRRRFRFSARFLAFLGRLVTNVDIHPGATIGRRFFVDHGAGVVIGETAEIGDDVTLYQGVTLGGTTLAKGKRHPTLKDGVLVGAGAKVLGAHTIGENARIGANSVVIGDVPPGMTVVGIPGRVVLPEDRRRRVAGDVDLDHHLMPDPVGRALACLVDRITELEARLAEVAPPRTPADACHLCGGPCDGACIGHGPRGATVSSPTHGSSPMTTSPFLTEMNSLSAAEDFFEALDVPFDPQVVRVNRLHILKRFSDYLKRTDMGGLDDDALRALYREKLAIAHADFVQSDAVTEKVFKVFKDAHGKAFVGLEEIEVLSVRS
ncbi:serine O-acetyltransferase [Caenispirillum salinarum]|uniref:serine O-acetyltransferase n=1 Tax=Caenispirillum salinarum TaxID=859058 RepID=UPI00384AA618